MLGSLYVLLGSSAAGAAGFLIGKSLVISTRKRPVTSALLDEDERSFTKNLVRNGIRPLFPFAGFLLGFRPIETWTLELVRYCEERDYLTAPEPILGVFLALDVVGASVFALLSRSILGGLVFAVGFALSIVWLIRSSTEKRWNQAREGIPDALNAMGVCFKSGFSLVQTLSQVSTETQEPLSGRYRRAAHLLETGSSTSEALKVFQSNRHLPELAFVAVALDVQHQAGGSIQSVLEAARDSIEDQLELLRSLKVQTAQAKLSSRIVTLMPFVLVGIFSLMSPGFLEPFFSSFLGIALLGVALAMEVAGIFLVRKILNVNLS